MSRDGPRQARRWPWRLCQAGQQVPRGVDGRRVEELAMDSAMRVRNVVLALLGAAILVLKLEYHGPGEAVVQAYAGNVAVSFALYFAAINATERFRRPRLLAALGVLVAVEAFELSDGFGDGQRARPGRSLGQMRSESRSRSQSTSAPARVLRRGPREASTDPQAVHAEDSSRRRETGNRRQW